MNPVGSVVCFSIKSVKSTQEVFQVQTNNRKLFFPFRFFTTDLKTEGANISSWIKQHPSEGAAYQQ